MTDTINIFVYGTLRVDQGNDRWSGLSKLADPCHPNVCTSGRMYNVHGDAPVYPVVNFDEPGEVWGDLYMNLPVHDPMVVDVHNMERGAGYEMRRVSLKVGEDYVDAYVYHMDTNRRRPGAHITDGNWLRFVNEPLTWQDNDDLWDDDAQEVDA
jgi:gamma-glutamylcyclotransferase (GGCT)/AIG2-like uncharacterized protein YtfP